MDGIGRIRELMSELGKPKTRYAFGVHRIPSSLDELPASIVDLILRLPAERRADVLSLVKAEQSNRLMTYGLRMASYAVRRKSKELLRRSLIAIAVSGSTAEAEMQEIIGVLPLPYRSAELIGVDPDELYTEAALFAGRRMADLMWTVQHWSPAQRDIRQQLFEESHDEDGFIYRSFRNDYLEKLQKGEVRMAPFLGCVLGPGTIGPPPATVVQTDNVGGCGQIVFGCSVGTDAAGSPPPNVADTDHKG